MVHTSKSTMQAAVATVLLLTSYLAVAGPPFPTDEPDRPNINIMRFTSRPSKREPPPALPGRCHISNISTARCLE